MKGTKEEERKKRPSWAPESQRRLLVKEKMKMNEEKIVENYWLAKAQNDPHLSPSLH